MKYGVVLSDGFIAGVCKSESHDFQKNITKEEYDTILHTLTQKPSPPDGFDYQLLTDLTWELCELPIAEADPELSAEEALEIITGGAE